MLWINYITCAVQDWACWSFCVLTQFLVFSMLTLVVTGCRWNHPRSQLWCLFQSAIMTVSYIQLSSKTIPLFPAIICLSLNFWNLCSLCLNKMLLKIRPFLMESTNCFLSWDNHFGSWWFGNRGWLCSY